MDTNKEESSWSGWYALAGLAVGAAAGLLLAPKRGSELRFDIQDWGRRNGKKTQSWFSSVASIFPTRVKAAAGIGALKNGTKEGIELAKEKARDFVGS